MRYFTERFISEKCMPFEAVNWLILGELPVLFPNEEGIEQRGLKEHYTNYEGMFRPDSLSEAALKYFAPNFDYDEYLQLERAADPSNRPKGFDEAFFSNPYMDDDGNVVDHSAFEEYNRKLFDSHDLAVREASETFSIRLGRVFHEASQAKTKLVAKLISGALNLYGVYAADHDDLYRKLLDDAEFTPTQIPNEVITLEGIDWIKCEVTLRSGNSRNLTGTYHCVTFSTKELISAFPLTVGKTVNAQCFNNNVFIDEENDSIPAQNVARRGRPAKADWLRDAMQGWYRTQVSKGKLGTGKIEADIAAAMEWAENCGHSVSRGTVQAYLRDLLNPSGSQKVQT